jgi:hypothetical protein
MGRHILEESPTKATCPVCDSIDLVPVLSSLAVPVFQNSPAATEADALGCRRGDIALVFCRACGFVFNAAFDAALVTYSPGYEPNQAYSPTFGRYLDELARDLVSRHALQGKTIMEIGCGDGDFLLRVCREGANRGVGFDPSYKGNRATLPPSVTILSRPYEPGLNHPPADLVCARHVVEHMEQPLTLLRQMHSAVAGCAASVLFVETPRLEWILAQSAFWDIFYEHCSYFTAAALGRLLQRADFTVVGSGAIFGGQYQWIEGRPGPAFGGDDEGNELLSARLEDFARSFEAHRAEWPARVGDLSRRGGCVVWGAGAKGVTFLNTLALGREVVPAVVDVNPQKQGRYVPGTGQPIIGPAELPRYRAASILVMNPNYLDEVRTMARSVAPGADVVAV